MLKWLKRSLALSVLSLSGCAVQHDLYSNLSENEINQMLAILRDHDFNANKVSLGKNLYSVTVIEPQIAAAIQLLRQWGYPKRTHTNLGELFSPDELVPTRTSEHVRFIYGISQELTTTLSLLDGIVEANVHISLSSLSDLETNNEANNETSASVFIKYDPNRINLEVLIPRIRTLIAHSLPELSEDTVDLLSQPVEFLDLKAVNEPMRKIGKLQFRAHDVSYVLGFFGILLGINIILLVALVLSIIRTPAEK